MTLGHLARHNRPQFFQRRLQSALVLGLARFLAEYDADRIPADRKIQVRRLAIVADAATVTKLSHLTTNSDRRR